MRIGNGHGANGGSDCRINLRDRCDTIKQSAQIKAGAPHQDRQASSRMRLINLNGGFSSPAGRGTRFRSVNMAEQAMRYSCHVIGAWPCRKDSQIGIYLTGIGVNDDAVRRLRQSNRQRALAACGRPGNKRDARAGFAL